MDRESGGAPPTLIIHGAADRIIPYRDAEALFAAATDADKLLLKIEKAGHNDLLVVAPQRYFTAIGDLVRRAVGGD